MDFLTKPLAVQQRFEKMDEKNRETVMNPSHLPEISRVPFLTDLTHALLYWSAGIWSKRKHDKEFLSQSLLRALRLASMFCSIVYESEKP